MRRTRPEPSFVFFALVLCLTLLPRYLFAQEITLVGWFHIVWGEVAHFDLVDDSGRSWVLKGGEKLFGALGGAQAVNGKRVRVVGERIETLLDTIVILDIQLAETSTRPLREPIEAAAVTSKPFVNILCEFPNSPPTPQPASHYVGLMGRDFPGLDHYWRENSYGLIDLNGSAVVGPYTLPQPRSYYVYDRDGDGVPEVDFQRTVTGCTAAADADVNFPDFFGINQIFNADIGGPSGRTSWGGSRTLTIDGQTKKYGVTWISLSGSQRQSLFAHEMGHSFGLPHSSGPYNETYDSEWDVMSGQGICTPSDPVYGCVGPHTISYHKDKLGWFTAAQKLDVNSGESSTIILDRLATPPSNDNFRMARIPIPDSSIFYTVEARQVFGYDTQIPGEGVIIHRVDPVITGLNNRPARVVDPDDNGNPNDGGAIWTVGETFSTVDVVPITVTVNAATATGYQVTICNDPPPSVLTVNKFGTGDGTIGSKPSVISCGTDCLEKFNGCPTVMLSAKPAAGSIFVKWTGDCVGRGSCKLTMGANKSVTATFDVAPPPLTMVGTTFPTGEVGMPYNGSVLVAGGYPPYLVTVIKSHLPPGLNFAFPDVSGTPTQAGNATLTLKIVDQLGTALKKTLKAKIVNAVNITTTSLRTGILGNSYNAALKVSGGLKPFNWTVASGALPGLNLDPATGKITGVPTDQGTFNIAFQVTDSLGGLHQRMIPLVIN
ncbi:MAG: putative Ig domain-containing protein [Deltaproteobacteria bacterium]|nr:putative Ig domain-containing protein [Deltaproteobacteria bacterium]